ncbi:hypothetical protein GALL_375510 [mine drainage metagenome]|uniref:Uncharacterized protein n=1 Tax=mine drainage metagenome TaxID=410659 RepID=A0A1J5QAL2_9ZZZZ
MLPDSRSGAIRMSASPATGETMPLVRAARSDTALSNASGPSSRPPTIWPRSAILHSAAASSVDGILGLTVSTAERIATFGSALPIAWASSMAFCTMSRLASRSGSTFTAASDSNSRRSRPTTSMTKAWLTRRAVRSPVCASTTACINSSVCSEPFIIARTVPSRTIATACAAAAWLCSVATIR